MGLAVRGWQRGSSEGLAVRKQCGLAVREQ
jgi:hypothetical protein